MDSHRNRTRLEACAVKIGAGLPAKGTHRNRTRLEACAVKVGAGLPAKGLQSSPLQSQWLTA
ncbi:hypothetical protein KAM380_052300 [Aeromonas caviae]|nr:hypothetical protein KAM380_052300 [Aeromonas caviae]